MWGGGLPRDPKILPGCPRPLEVFKILVQKNVRAHLLSLTLSKNPGILSGAQSTVASVRLQPVLLT